MVPRGLKVLALVVLTAALGVLGSCGGDADDDGDAGDDRLALLEPVLVGEFGSVAVNIAFPVSPPGCLTIQPIPWTDSDGDEIPDAADFVFDAGGCAFDWGDASGTMHGRSTLADLGTDLGYTNTLAAMTYVFTEGSPTVTITRVLNGTRRVSGTRQVLVMEGNLTIGVTSSVGRSATMISDLTATFTADAGGEIHFGVGVPFPAGHYTLAGALTWIENADTTVFEVTTVTPLVYAAGCPSPFPAQGVFWLSVTDGPEPGRLIAGWNGCDSPMTLDWEPARAGVLADVHRP